MKRLFRFALIILIYQIVLLCGVYADVSSESPITKSHLNMIQSLFLENGLREAEVFTDQYGRVQLKGNYKDKKEVELAFSLAQSVSGVRWVSPVTPENVKVKEWAKKLSKLFPTTTTSPTPPPRTETTIPGVTSNKYALLVGISKFKSNEQYKLARGAELDLKYAEKDAREFYTYLTDSQHGGFKKENVYLLTNEEATTKNIHDSLNMIKNRTGYGDEVIIYFSSHGKPIYDGSMNILTYDTDTSSIYRTGMTSFCSEDLKDFILQAKAKNIIVVLDVCYSGKAFKNIKGFYNPKSNIDYDNDNQGISRTVMAKSLLGAKDIVFEDDVLKTSQTINKNSTKVLISASDQGQKSYESDILKSSIFTNYFLQGLKQQSNIKKAFEYAKPNVVKRVKEEKDAEQNPQVVTDKTEWGISL